MRNTVTVVFFFLLSAGLLTAEPEASAKKPEMPGVDEFRIWEDVQGNQYDAKFVRELFDKATLRTREGKEVRMAIEDFSDLDQKYFRVMVPPNITIDVDIKNTQKEKPFEINPEPSFVTTITQQIIHIKKKSKRAFTSRLYMEFYMIAKELDLNANNYVLLAIFNDSFLFNEQNNYSYTYKTKPIETESYIQKGSQGQRRGEEYIGYILVVRDAQGNLIELKTSIPGKWAKNPDLLPKLRNLMERGAGSIHSRHFDKEGNKTPIPRVRHWTNLT